MKVAVILHRFGPYHFARLRAAGQVLPVVAIETSGTDATYAWDKIAGAENFERVTLFADADAQKQPAAEVARRLVAVLEQTRPTVVAVPGWADAAALAALQWCGRNRVPAIIMSESTAGDEPRQSWKEFIKRQVVALGAAALAGGTPHRDYLTQLGMPVERIFLGYDAVDNRYFEDKVAEVRSQNSELRMGAAENGGQSSGAGVHDCQLPTDDCPLPTAYCPLPTSPFFLASARFIEKKNLPRLIEAYAVYRKKAETLKPEKLKDESRKQTPDAENPKSEFQLSAFPLSALPSDEFQLSQFQLSAFAPWNLVLLGDGALRSSLEAQVSSLALHDHVQMPGFIQYPELPAYYAHAGAFIHASTSEQWGLVVNEAMASGLPVLVSNRCGCAPDLVQADVNGFTFDPYNVEQLAGLMLKISAFDFPLSTFGDASRKIIANWGPDRFASGLKAAAACALKVEPIHPTFKQMLILKALLSR